MNLKRFIKYFPAEALTWIAALIYLAFYHPGSHTHFSLCPLYYFGFDFCPGCGLGRSISFLFHGEFRESFTAHPLGIIAVIILSYRIIQLTKTHFKIYGPHNRCTS